MCFSICSCLSHFPHVFIPNPMYIWLIVYLKIWDFKFFSHLKNNDNHSNLTYTVQNFGDKSSCDIIWMKVILL